MGQCLYRVVVMRPHSIAFWQHVRHNEPLNVSFSRELGGAWKHQGDCVCVCVHDAMGNGKAHEWRTCTHWRFFLDAFLWSWENISQLFFFSFRCLGFSRQERLCGWGSSLRAALDSLSHKHFFYWLSDTRLPALLPSWSVTGAIHSTIY